MAIVYLLKSCLWKMGGLEKQTLRIAGEFAGQGCQVNILTNGQPSGLSLPKGVQVIDVGRTSKMSLRHIQQFDRLCHKYSAYVIFGMERNTGVTHYRAGNGVHAEYLEKRKKTDSYFKRLSFRWNPLHQNILHMEKQTYESSKLQKLFTNSHMVKEEVLHHYNVDPAKIEVIHNGVEWEELAPHFDPVRDQNQPYHFLFVGNGYQRKGLSFLLEALAEMREPSFHLTVVGKEKKIKAYRKMAERLGISQKVTFHGPKSNLIPFYQQADALVVPSLYDPFANVTVEALAMGLYVVSSPYNGGKEVLAQNSGTVIENLFDRDAFIASLKKALENPKTSENARAIRDSVKHLTFENQLNRMISSTLAFS